jgi:hypothetical protein
VGAKAAFAVVVEGDVRESLRRAQPDAAAAAELLAVWLPAHSWSEPELSTLDATIYPSAAVGVLRVPGVDLVCSDDVLNWLVDGLPAQVRDAVGDRRLAVLAMHSVTDSLAFAVWEGGVRTRALAMDLESGIGLDEGVPLPVEGSFWAGQHPIGEDYPLPFHPLDLGEEMLRETLGFVLEGTPAPGDVEPWDVPVFAFHPERVPVPTPPAVPTRRGRWFSRGRR